ncbi:RING finger protein 37 [Coemansia erecta]|nr:RING finger protein 37 [Coemansia erecta]
MELFDYADSRLGTTVSCTCPCTTDYEVCNLLDKGRTRSRTAMGGGDQLPLPLGAQHLDSCGFMAESFVRPPIDITFTLPYQVSLASVVINPCIRRGRIKVVNMFTMGVNRDRWEVAGKLLCEAGMYGLHNGDVTPAMLSQAIGINAAKEIRWSVLRAPSASALHFVKQIKITIVAMHEAHAIGCGAIEIWAQPSQRLPSDQRVRMWKEAYQAVALPADSSARILPPVGAAASGSLAVDVSECPQEFIDPITHNIMADPVVLPSGACCDRSTIARHLDSHRTDPFTGLPLDPSQIEPDLALRLRVRSWLDSNHG